MKYFDRVLVGLDLSDSDARLTQVASLIANQLGAEKIYFLHVVDSLELPEGVTEKYPDLIAPVDENVKRMIQTNLDEHFQAVEGCDLEIEVVEGNPTEQILRWSKIKEVDLILMGKKAPNKGSGVITEKIIKISPCSVLLIPDSEVERIRKILVPIDFSTNSESALKEAGVLAGIAKATIIAQHCYRVPSGYHSTGKSYEEFASIMKGHAENDFEKFVADLGSDFEGTKCIFSLEDSHNVGHVIHEVAVENDIDLIVMGSKGRSGLASVLLGSVAMKTAKYDLEIPLLVLKDKKENLGFLDALLRL